MNEKKCFNFMLVCVLLFGFSSCRTGSGIYNHGNGAYSVRENLRELGEEQGETAITGERIKNSVGELERTIEDGAGDCENFKAILRRIRERGGGGDGGKGSGDKDAENKKTSFRNCGYSIIFDIDNYSRFRRRMDFHKTENGF